MELTSLARLILPLQVNVQMFVGYTILVSLTFILLTELSRILITMLEGSKYVLQISPAVIVSVWMDIPLFYIANPHIEIEL